MVIAWAYAIPEWPALAATPPNNAFLDTLLAECSHFVEQFGAGFGVGRRRAGKMPGKFVPDDAAVAVERETRATA